MRERTRERQTSWARMLEQKQVVTQTEGSEHGNETVRQKDTNMLPFVHSRLEGERWKRKRGQGAALARPSDPHPLALYCLEQNRRSSEKNAEEERKGRKKCYKEKDNLTKA